MSKFKKYKEWGGPSSCHQAVEDNSEWTLVGQQLLSPNGDTIAEREMKAKKHRLADLQAKHQGPGDAAQQKAKHRDAEVRNSTLAQVLD